MASPIEAALDARHDAAQAAFARRDLEAYAALFHPDLVYSLPDGTNIGREALMRDVRAQFARLDRASSTFTRERLDVDDAGAATETLTQSVVAEASAFGLLRRIWRIERRGDYRWVADGGDWKIAHVRLSRETSEARWTFGR